MHLENEPEAARTASKQRLTQDEMSELLDLAIARHSEAQQHGADLATIEDAVDVARQLNIPEEHVYAAAEELRHRRQIEKAQQDSSGYRLARRSAEKERRRKAFLVGAGVCAAVFVALRVLGGFAGGLFLGGPLLLALGLPPLVLLIRWLAPVSDQDADRAEARVVAGTCRVCGAKATTPRSTFCEEHRWRGPSG